MFPDLGEREGQNNNKMTRNSKTNLKYTVDRHFWSRFVRLPTQLAPFGLEFARSCWLQPWEFHRIGQPNN